MDRRQFVVSLGAATLTAAPVRFAADWESLKTHEVPAWYHDAKLGIFVHWGLYSVAAWAPPSDELGKVDWNKWFYENPYAEWYLNSIRLKESLTYKHHAATYGADFDYYRFAATFLKEMGKWKAASWAKLFRETGAQYSVLTTKHHDGFTLWPS
jgi:alpha-L-fucosidase